MIPKEVLEALNTLEEYAEDYTIGTKKAFFHKEIVLNFLKTTDAYIKQLEQDYDEAEVKSVKGSYGGSD